MYLLEGRKKRPRIISLGRIDIRGTTHIDGKSRPLTREDPAALYRGQTGQPYFPREMRRLGLPHSGVIRPGASYRTCTVFRLAE